jgi:serine/threonine-protein kinase
MNAGDLVAEKYRLVRVLGDGAMGKVWAAINERTHGEVALKVIPNPNPELAARMIREARACGSLRHPNIVEIHDVGETDGGNPFLVMQILSGETLAERLVREGPMPSGKAAAITSAIARALRAAHAKGIVHRDLKPANVFLHSDADAEGEVVKVLDFGVSKNLASNDDTRTQTGVLVGSPAYMSPEQARADKHIDHRSDLWSVGVVLFEMLAGHRPFPSRTPYGAIAEILSAPLPSLLAQVPDADPRLARIVERCLVRDAAQRVASAEELLQLLRPFLDDVGGAADGGRRMSSLPDVAPPPPQRLPSAQHEADEPSMELPTTVLDTALLGKDGEQATCAEEGEDYAATGVIDRSHLASAARTRARAPARSATAATLPTANVEADDPDEFAPTNVLDPANIRALLPGLLGGRARDAGAASAAEASETAPRPSSHDTIPLGGAAPGAPQAQDHAQSTVRMPSRVTPAPAPPVQQDDAGGTMPMVPRPSRASLPSAPAPASASGVDAATATMPLVEPPPPPAPEAAGALPRGVVLLLIAGVVIAVVLLVGIAVGRKLGSAGPASGWPGVEMACREAPSGGPERRW